MGTLKLFPALLFIFLAFDWVATVGFGAQTPPDEVNALKLIGKSLGKTDWNFSVDPCSRTYGWVTEPNGDIVDFKNEVTCNCTFEDNTACHVITILLKAQNLSGVLPLELGGLPFLQNLDLSRNFLHGTIPPGWGSSGLVVLSLFGNRLSGHIPTELGSITSLVELNVEVNQLSGPIPRELRKLINLKRLLISSNPLTGQLPEELASLTNMEDFRIRDTNISGKIPHFIQNWTKLDKLVIQGCPMEGPIPSGISGLINLSDLRISDISGTGWSFPDLSKMLNMKILILRNCLIFGTIPEYIANMTSLKTLDLSFNNLTGEIPKSFGSLRNMKFMYLTSNMLTGSLPDWILRKNQNVDVSYNNLTWSSYEPNSCEQRTINLVESYSLTMSSLANPCLKKDFPCSGSKHFSLYINCGGKAIPINDTMYEEDWKVSGASTSHISENWAFSSTGDFMNNNPDNDNYIATNISMLSMAHSDLYATARLSPISLTYYGLCMINENYNVKLHFAEIMFTNDTTFSSLGRRIFDVYIQGKLVLKDFNIHDEAGGVGKAVVKNFTATVTRNTLEIRFLWAGKGTQTLPRRGVYGPLISAISVDPDFVPRTGDKKLSAIVTVAIVASVLSVILLVLVILWRAGWFGSKATAENSEYKSIGLSSEIKLKLNAF